MKQSIIYINLLIPILIFVSYLTAKDDFPVLERICLDQKSPGITSEIFAPGIKSTDKNEACSDFEIRVEKIGARLFKMSYKVNNWIALIGPDGVLLSDAAPEFLAQSIKKKLVELGNGKVKYIINTHWHHDHTGANLLFGKAAIVVAHHSVRCHLAEKQEISLFEETFEAYPEDALPDITFSTSLKIHFNGEEIDMISLPGGHSQGDVVVYFKHSNVLHVGDLYIADNFPPIDYDHGGDVQQFAKNLETIMQMFPANVKIVSGHLQDATIKNLSIYHHIITTTTNIIREELKNGRSLGEMQKANILKDWEAWGKHVSCSLWIKTIFHSLTKKNKGG